MSQIRTMWSNEQSKARRRQTLFHAESVSTAEVILTATFWFYELLVLCDSRVARVSRTVGTEGQEG